MKVLVLSCNTGGGHNSCAKYIQEELILNNIECDYKNYFEIVHLSKKDYSNKIYVKSLGKKGGLFKYIYKIGEAYDKTNIVSPIYLIHKLYSHRLYKYIKKMKYDLVICPHLFPSLALTAVNKKHKVNFLFVDTDYGYQPFTSEIKADYYIIPKNSAEQFIRRGILKDKLVPLGIPVASNYIKKAKTIKSKSSVGKKTILILLGSMGFGNIKKILDDLLMIKDVNCIVVCGKNKKLYNDLQKIDNNSLTVIGYCQNVNDLIKSSDIVISKPGGLSSTEIAAFRKGLIHIFPIPGSETINTEYFLKNNLSFVANNKDELLMYVNVLLQDSEAYKKMIESQKEYIPSTSAKDLVNFIKDKYKNN